MRTFSTIVFLTVLHLGGCSQRLRPPDTFAVLQQSMRRGYDERAITADGLVLAARRFPSPENATSAFWAQAIGTRMSETGGYNLIGTEAVRASNGRAGQLLRFQRSYAGEEFAYWVALYTVGPDVFGNRSVFVVESGGPLAVFTREEARIRQALLDFQAD